MLVCHNGLSAGVVGVQLPIETRQNDRQRASPVAGLGSELAHLGALSRLPMDTNDAD